MMYYKNVCLLFAIGLLLSQCTRTAEEAKMKEQIFQFRANQVRLSDGVPLDFNCYIYWNIEYPKAFLQQYDSLAAFTGKVLQPRAAQSVLEVAHRYDSVDSVFGGQRPAFMAEVKQALKRSLQMEGIIIREVTIADLSFPSSYLEFKQRAGLQRQELENIKQQTVIEIAQVEKERKMTEVRARVQVAQEEANAKILDIQTKSEERKRASELARAETQAQLDFKKAMSEAERQRTMNGVELEKLTQLKDLEISKTSQLNENEWTNQTELARLHEENPRYTSFLVNKELAGKIHMAVLPTGSSPDILTNFWKGLENEK